MSLRTHRVALPAAGLLAALLAATLAAPTPAQIRPGQGRQPGEPAPEPPREQIPPRSERVTRIFVAYYEEAKEWPIRALALLALGSHWHPAGSGMVTDALGDDAMRPFAIELLRQTRQDVLRAVADDALVEALLRAARERNQLVRERVVDVLKKLAGDDAGIADRGDFERWWRGAKRDGYTPAEWPAIPEQAEPAGGETSTAPLDRAIDLRDAGLDLVVVIDSTGSMQSVIDQATDALADVIAILEAIAPKFRVGVVHYRDFEDMSEGAELLEALSPRAEKARASLAKIRADGGGDAPERVEKGLAIAYDRRTGWRPDANKLVIVVGDAPPHPETESELLAMVRQAYEDPGSLGARSRGPTTGARPDQRPFVTSTISAGTTADRPMREIAEAGHGSFAQLHVRDGSQSAPRRIAEHVLVNAFGSTWRNSVASMLAVWFEYRDAGALR
ncbi:MAG: VWA domain-containing protein [Planctomycetes bacterium]|nr:VWA domain-containing protein [Planctomycetota bacterium]